MKKVVPILLVLLVLSLFLASTAMASSSSQAVAGCRRGYTLDLFANHAAETQYPGYLRDLNGDGYICVYNITPNVHRHIDNFMRNGCRGR